MSFFGRISQAKLFRFGVTGGLCFLFALLILYVGTGLLRLHYLLSMLIALVAGNLFALALNRLWTFESTTNPLQRDARRFLTSNLLSMGLAMLLMKLLVSAGLHYLVANILISALFFFGNFLLHSRWSFRKDEPGKLKT